MFRSESVLFLAGGGEIVGSVAEKSEKDTICGVLDVTSLPWRCFGAGGGFLFSFLISLTRLALSSSDPAISYDVRGDSGCGSCTGSNMDCREMDDVSVLLLSKTEALMGLGAVAAGGGGPELRGLDIPVMSRFLKPSTSSDAFVEAGAALSVAVRSTAKHISGCPKRIHGSNIATLPAVHIF